ncbi:Ras subfamily protein [Acanthamoeba castellanii str. Neff]|uniref:Ras subfamily protein n=1 Tax=Acanthamoeba castellanii (strain ATCC 30010 / Neff) TaxID=1257118 RepID=L8HCN9_ACACF|nr:Ras subfamily protein [Acanthamoeba castellanii str. Neff]ELR23002.1 Ras subfamily protein [Acanthamoeba castellanii str. Neff]
MSLDLDLKLDFVKVRLAGDHGIGKTSLMTRFLDDSFQPTQVTIDQEVKFKTCTALGETFKVQLIDTAGQERFRTVTSSYYRGANGVLLTFDITSKESFDDLQEWAVSTEEAKAYAEKLGASYVETSAKEGKGVQEAFDLLLTQIVEKVPEAGRGTAGAVGKGKTAKSSSSSRKGVVDLNDDGEKKKKKKGCTLF